MCRRRLITNVRCGKNTLDDWSPRQLITVIIVKGRRHRITEKFTRRGYLTHGNVFTFRECPWKLPRHFMTLNGNSWAFVGFHGTAMGRSWVFDDTFIQALYDSFTGFHVGFRSTSITHFHERYRYLVRDFMKVRETDCRNSFMAVSMTYLMKLQ